MAHDLLLLAGIGTLLLAASVGLYRLLSPTHPDGPPGDSEPGGPALSDLPRIEGRQAERLEGALRPLFRRTLLLQYRTIADPRVGRLTAAVVERLRRGGGAELEILVLDSPIVNAYAFPGGLIAVHRGLLARLNGPEELAAVLAHEMGHVARHDSLNGLVRALGVSFLISLATGGSETVLRDVLERAFALRYGRKAEERADRYALDLLVRARIDPARFADALGRLESGAPPALLRYLDTHPDPGARMETARRRSAEERVPAEPLQAEWPRELFDRSY